MVGLSCSVKTLIMMDLVIASGADINVYFDDINIAEADNLLILRSPISYEIYLSLLIVESNLLRFQLVK